jgi:hypothetical protein
MAVSLRLLGQPALLQRDGHWSALINRDAALLAQEGAQAGRTGAA